LTVDIMT